MKNDYEIRGNVVAIFLDSKKYGRMETIIDLEDLSRVQEFENTWHVQCNVRKKTFYAIGNTPKVKGVKKVIGLHRFLTKAENGKVVDHKNHDTLDNRRSSNLRMCSNAENLRNSVKKNNNKGKYKGVSFRNDKKKWQANITLNMKQTFLGYYNNETEAAKAYNEAALKYHGEFANLNIIEESP